MIGKQSQEAAQGATAVQAGGSAIVIQGISYEAARQIAMDVYQANFPVLVQQAAELARSRAEELTDKFLKQLSEQNPKGIEQAVNPAFQNALLKAQREHACAGDSDLANLLVDLLVDRTKQAPRSLIQLVIDQALETAPKLTEEQLAVLGAVFVLGHARSTADTWPAVAKWFQRTVEPVLTSAVVTPSTLAHLQFTGCARIREIRGIDLAAGVLETYSGFFQTGFSRTQLDEKALPPSALNFVGPLGQTEDLLEVRFASAAVIDQFEKAGRLDAEGAIKLKELLTTHRKPMEEFRAQLIGELPFMQRAFDFWQAEDAGRLELSSVGLAIGHAFVKKTLGTEFASLEIWIK
jgi:hypothetical protein